MPRHQHHDLVARGITHPDPKRQHIRGDLYRHHTTGHYTLLANKNRYTVPQEWAWQIDKALILAEARAAAAAGRDALP
jgi:hypothetical protein